MNITGTITYDYIPITAFDGLDYNAIESRPVRGAIIEAIDGTGVILASTETNASGAYSVQVSSNRMVRLRVKAQTQKTGIPNWNIRVEDNTSSNALYVMDGALVSSGTSNSIRDLHADSGWGGSSYTQARVAAPFAILDSVYTALLVFLQVDASLQLPTSIFRWSANNTTANGSYSDGDIGTSFYDGAAVYILGEENTDTDEYDRHVIIHEWGHFIDDKLSRTDTFGGSHSGGDRLDMRTAMSEGFATGFSGIMLDSPVYSDSFGSNQQLSGGLDISNSSPFNPGWYSEASVLSIIYNYGDFASIYNVITHPSYKNANALISIFTFAERLLALSTTAQGSTFTNLLNAQNINSTDQFGVGESNNGGMLSVLPIYKNILPDGNVVNICSSAEQGKFNKMGVRQFFRLPISVSANYTVTMQKNGGANESTDPDIHIFYRGLALTGPGGTGIDVDIETFATNLNAGEIYVIEVHDWNHLGGDDYAETCFDVSIEPTL